jgi:hypothetical protein
MAPSTTAQWTVEGTTGFDALKFSENTPIPEVGDKDVLVKSRPLIQQSLIVGSGQSNPVLVHAASLNYRDLAIPKGKYPFPVKENIVPGSDGAGIVESVGKQVTRFKPGGW